MVLWNVGLGHSNKGVFMDELIGASVICLNEGQFGADYKLRGYISYMSQGNSGRKSLATILVRQDIPQSRVDLPTVENINLCAVRVKLDGKVLNITTCYISPNVKPNIVRLGQILKGVKNLVFLGDLNGKAVAWGSPNTDARGRELAEMIDELDLTILNDGSFTFRRNFQGGMVESHLDVGCVSANLTRDLAMEIDPTPVGSDHCKLRVFLKAGKGQKWRTAHVVNWISFKSQVDQMLERGDDIQQAIKEGKMRCTYKVRVPPNGPSPDMRLKSLLDELKSCRKRARKFGGLVDYIDCDLLKEEIDIYSRELKSCQVHRYVSGLRYDTKLSDVWNWAREMSCNQQRRPIDAMSVESGLSTKHHLTKLLESLMVISPGNREEIGSERYNKSEVDPNLFLEFTMWELELAINGSNPKSAAGPDGIGNRELRSLSGEAREVLLSHINNVTRSGSIPEEWKEGAATPLLKAGRDPSKIASYRVIVKTSNVCKILERMIARRLNAVLEEVGALSPQESAYRALRSTHDNILDVTSGIENALKMNDHVVAVFFDVSGAYNNLCHAAVAEMLVKLGWPITHPLHRIVMDLLTDRRLTMSSGGITSVTKTLENVGVSQGGVLSPALFVAVLHRIRACVPVGYNLSQFSDDGVLWVRSPGKTRSEFIGVQLGNILTEISRELAKIGLTLEASKTVGMMVGAKRGQKLRVRINGVGVRQVKCHKFLGIVLDDKGKWGAEVKEVCDKARKVETLLRNCCGVEWGISPRNAIQMIKGLVLSKVNYVIPYMGGLSKSQLKQIDDAVARGVRIALGLLRSTASQVALAEAGIMPVELSMQHRLELHLARMVRVDHPGVKDLSEKRRETPAAKLLEGREWSIEKITCPVMNIELIRDFEMVVERKGEERLKAWEAIVDERAGAGYVMFTDGSYNRENGKGGAAVVGLRGDLIEEVFVEGAEDSTGPELVAILCAFKRASLIEGEVTVFTDSQRAMQLISSLNPRQIYFDLVCEVKEELCKRGLYHTTLQWVPAHSEVVGNQSADSAAKQASLGSSHLRVVSVAGDYVRVRQKITARWQERWDRRFREVCRDSKRVVMGLGTNIKVPETGAESRKTAVEVHRLRCGKAMTPSTMFQVRMAPSPACTQCLVHGDVVHLLEECSMVRRERKRWSVRVAEKSGTQSPALEQRMRTEFVGELARFVGEMEGRFGGVRGIAVVEERGGCLSRERV